MSVFRTARLLPTLVPWSWGLILQAAAALLLSLSPLAPPPAAAQTAQRVCSLQLVATGPRRVGEDRAREAAIAEFDALLIRHHGAVNAFSAAQGLSDRTVAVTCRRDNARQSCTASGHVCVLSQARPLCSGPQRIDVNGLEDTCQRNPAPIPQAGRRPAYVGGGTPTTGPITCPRGYQRRVQAGPDHCVLPGY